MNFKRKKLKIGQWVEVRTKEEILQTLDTNGQLEGMPFMPEMLQFCGERFQVYKRAHKTCDPDFRSRRVPNAVHLETRCDGQAHGGCQAGCTFFWKEVWLKPVTGKAAPRGGSAGLKSSETTGCTEGAIWNGTQQPSISANETEIAYICQTTQVQFQEPMKWWDIRQYVEDYRSGNVSLWRLVCGLVYSSYYNLSQAGIGVGPAMRWFYNVAYPLWNGSKWPRTTGTIPQGQPTPTLALDLQPGELVRVKSHEEILRTLDTASKNRGLQWDAELVPYCGKTYRVAHRAYNVLDERTGKMIRMKNPSILLDSVICAARYSPCRLFCPRGTYSYFREIWLERVRKESSPVTQPPVARKGNGSK